MIEVINNLYNQFISLFPPELQVLISLIIFIAVVVWVIQLVRDNILWLVLLIILIPASIPVLRVIITGILAFLDNLI